MPQTAHEAVAAAVETAQKIDARDAEGKLITLGAAVHFVPQKGLENSPWTADRWGIVTGIDRMRNRRPGANRASEFKVEIRVSNAVVADDEDTRWNNNEWFAAPRKLVVINQPTNQE